MINTKRKFFEYKSQIFKAKDQKKKGFFLVSFENKYFLSFKVDV